MYYHGFIEILQELLGNTQQSPTMLTFVSFHCWSAKKIFALPKIGNDSSIIPKVKPTSEINGIVFHRRKLRHRWIGVFYQNQSDIEVAAAAAKLDRLPIVIQYRVKSQYWERELPLLGFQQFCLTRINSVNWEVLYPKQYLPIWKKIKNVYVLVFKSILFGIILNAVFAFKKKLDSFQKWSRHWWRWFPQEDFHGIFQVHAHDAIATRRMRATFAVAAIDETICNWKQNHLYGQCCRLLVKNVELATLY